MRLIEYIRTVLDQVEEDSIEFVVALDERANVVSNSQTTVKFTIVRKHVAKAMEMTQDDFDKLGLI